MDQLAVCRNKLLFFVAETAKHLLSRLGHLNVRMLGAKFDHLNFRHLTERYIKLVDPPIALIKEELFDRGDTLKVQITDLGLNEGGLLVAVKLRSDVRLVSNDGLDVDGLLAIGDTQDRGFPLINQFADEAQMLDHRFREDKLLVQKCVYSSEEVAFNFHSHCLNCVIHVFPFSMNRFLQGFPVGFKEPCKLQR